MQLQSGKLYENRTWKYLYPCLNAYGKTLKNYLNSFFKLGVGIKDCNIDSIEERSLYILIDAKISSPHIIPAEYRERLEKFLEWVRYQPFYKTDYVYEGIRNSEKHMLVIKFPSVYYKAYDKFLLGEYSKMFTSQEIETLFSFSTLKDKKIETLVNSRKKDTRNILTKHANNRGIFLKKLNEEFNTDLTLEDIEEHELDFPPVEEEETFNFKKDYAYGS